MGGDTRSHRTLSRAIRGGLILAAALAAAPAWSVTYRWVDEKGAVHYGDSIPPQYAGQGHTELNAQGRVVKRVDRAARTPEERARLEQERARKEAAEREERDRARRDAALMATYASVDDLDKARTRALAREVSLLESLRLLRVRSTSPAEVQQLDAMIKTRETEVEAVKTRFDADRARYLELRQGR